MRVVNLLRAGVSANNISNTCIRWEMFDSICLLAAALQFIDATIQFDTIDCGDLSTGAARIKPIYIYIYIYPLAYV